MLKRKRVEKSVPEKPHIVKRGCFLILAILLGVPVSFCIFALVVLFFPRPDYVNPVTRIEYILEIDFPDEQIIKADYYRLWGDGDVFEISLIMNQSDFEDLVLHYCYSLEVIRESHDPQYTHTVRPCYPPEPLLVSWSFDIDLSDPASYIVDIRGEIYQQCNSTSRFTLDYPCN